MKRANAKEAAKALNSFIGSMKDSTLEQITKKMREFNIPYGQFLIRDFIKRNYLIAVGGVNIRGRTNVPSILRRYSRFLKVNESNSREMPRIAF